ncbi:hypothetical protein T209_03905 [Mycobacterium tuberculosis]|uniref:Uncharacterized protein n=1 Tax=Mycobacterium tuberculosis TaxID=1773 RepID=A0A655A4J3_MYCTX|nr:hypothetical protein T209_03905 [Mycobacterium tuberculosis]AIH66647.1 hypothetical protein IU17_03875 [Mycobacterium tuberculosis]AIH77469.1 hypothetical protein IU14_03865 [Mycobacterium tuberculosis]AIH84757.1 hypothetical protein IU15_04030 [Mycobacterium tuberculosis]CKM35335.1 Uncharacterised protein [Mycobacterium tuberculosis]
MREQDSLTTDLDAPGHLASVAILGFIGDSHSLRSGFVAESRHAARGSGRTFFLGALESRQLANHRNFFTVDDDGGVAVEPVLGQAASEPFRRPTGIWLLSLLPAAGATVAPPVHVMVPHNYMITYFHL